MRRYAVGVSMSISFLRDWAEVLQYQEPLAPYTYLRLGGPAQVIMQPRTAEELSKVVERCRHERFPVRLLGGGCNLLVRDEGVPGLVLRLTSPAFTTVTVEGLAVKAGGGASLSALLSEAARHSLAGLESLIGIPGSVGGSLRCQAGARTGNINQSLRRLEVLTSAGHIVTYERDDIPLEQLTSGPEELLVLSAEFGLEEDHPEMILKRMRKYWIDRKAHQPLSFQATARLFRDEQGLPAEDLINQAGAQQTQVGGVRLSERNPNYVLAEKGATARDVLRLVEMVRSQVHTQLGQELQVGLVIW